MLNLIKVCHFTSAHKADDTRIFVKECSSLAMAGFDVTLVAPNSNEEVINNVSIVSAFKAEGGRLTRMTKTVWNVYKKAKSINADVYHFHDPELLTVALLLKNKRNKIIFDAHEDLPRQILAKHWIPLLLRKPIAILAEFIEDFIVARLDGVVTATPFIEKRFLKINKNTVGIFNYPVLSELQFDEAPKKENAVVYVGGLTKVRGITEMVNALNLCTSNVKLNLAGAFSPESLSVEISNLPGWNKVNFLGYVNRTEIRDTLLKSKIGIVTLYPTLNHLDSLPIKIFEYMAAGIPVIASNFPYWIELFKNYDCITFVNPYNEQEIANAIDFLLQNESKANEMGAIGKCAAKEQFNWGVEELKITAFYKKITNTK